MTDYSTIAETRNFIDKFDTLTHSISDGLPREIELRQKQYEHYHDQILQFTDHSSQCTNKEASDG